MKQALGARISHYRELAGLTQAKLADALAVDKGTIWRWESGQSWPDYKQLVALGKRLNVAPERFFETVSGPLSATAEELLRMVTERDREIGRLKKPDPFPELRKELEALLSEFGEDGYNIALNALYLKKRVEAGREENARFEAEERERETRKRKDAPRPSLAPVKGKKSG